MTRRQIYNTTLRLKFEEVHPKWGWSQSPRERCFCSSLMVSEACGDYMSRKVVSSGVRFGFGLVVQHVWLACVPILVRMLSFNFSSKCCHALSCIPMWGHVGLEWGGEESNVESRDIVQMLGDLLQCTLPRYEELFCKLKSCPWRIIVVWRTIFKLFPLIADAVYVEIGCDLLRFDLDHLSWFKCER